MYLHVNNLITFSQSVMIYVTTYIQAHSFYECRLGDRLQADARRSSSDKMFEPRDTSFYVITGVRE